MKTIITLLTALVLIAGTIAGGEWRRQKARAGDDALLHGAAEKLALDADEAAGSWRLSSQSPLPADAVARLQCPAHIHRTYIHESTGRQLSMFVVLGPPGPIAVHTPEACYAGQGFSLAEQRSPVTVSDATGAAHSFWQVSMQPSDVGREPLRVYYAWSAGGPWSAAREPRFAYAGAPYLYKIQVAISGNVGPGEPDPCLDFLAGLLPQLQPCLLPPLRP